MILRNIFLAMMTGMVVIGFMTFAPPSVYPVSPLDEPSLTSDGKGASPGAVPDILTEIFLTRDHRNEAQEIKREFERFSIHRVNIQFFRDGHPPKNVAIGKNVPAEVARGAMRLAIKYNQGIDYLLAEFRFRHEYIAIGTSAFDEASQIPILPRDLERLMDPSLSTPQFHKLYHELTRDTHSEP